MDQLDPVDAHEVGDVAREQRRRSYGKVIGVAVGIAVLGAAGFVAMHQLDKKANDRVDAAWGKLSRCLVGEPLGQNELASMRLRRVQLTAFGVHEKLGEGDTALWPERCGAFAHGVSEALRDAGRSEKEGNDLAAQTEAIAKALTDATKGNPLTRDFGSMVDALYTRAAEEKVEVAASSDVPPPPQPAAPYDLDAIAAVAPMSKTVFSLIGVTMPPHASRDVHLLIEDKSAPQPWSLCTVDAAAARCKPLPPAVVATKSGLRLLGTTDDGAAPLVFAGNRGTDGIFRSDTGELVDKMYSYGGYIARDGSISVLGYDDAKKELRLLQKPKDGALKATTFKPDLRIGNAFYNAMILFDAMVLRGVNKDDQRRLFAQSLSHLDKPGKGMTDIGPLPEAGLVEVGEDEPHISGCRTAEALAVRVKGYSNEFISFDINNAWREPIGSRAQGGYMTCRKAEATITRIDNQTVTQNRCTTAGCKRESVQLDTIVSAHGELAPRTDFLQATDLDGKLLVVWMAGEKGGLRYRYAPIERIAQAPDVLLYDDMVEGSKVGSLSTLFGMGLLGREGYAVIVLATKAGVVTLRFTPDGKVAPLPAQHSG